MSVLRIDKIDEIPSHIKKVLNKELSDKYDEYSDTDYEYSDLCEFSSISRLSDYLSEWCQSDESESSDYIEFTYSLTLDGLPDYRLEFYGSMYKKDLQCICDEEYSDSFCIIDIVMEEKEELDKKNSKRIKNIEKWDDLLSPCVTKDEIVDLLKGYKFPSKLT